MLGIMMMPVRGVTPGIVCQCRGGNHIQAVLRHDDHDGVHHPPRRVEFSDSENLEKLLQVGDRGRPGPACAGGGVPARRARVTVNPEAVLEILARAVTVNNVTLAVTAGSESLSTRRLPRAAVQCRKLNSLTRRRQCGLRRAARRHRISTDMYAPARTHARTRARARTHTP